MISIKQALFSVEPIKGMTFFFKMAAFICLYFSCNMNIIFQTITIYLKANWRHFLTKAEPTVVFALCSPPTKLAFKNAD